MSPWPTAATTCSASQARSAAVRSPPSETGCWRKRRRCADRSCRYCPRLGRVAPLTVVVAGAGGVGGEGDVVIGGGLRRRPVLRAGAEGAVDGGPGIGAREADVPQQAIVEPQDFVRGGPAAAPGGQRGKRRLGRPHCRVHG